MTNRSKQKGTSAETAVVTYLQDNGFPAAERRALAGNLDKGDIAGVPHTVIEVKNCERINLAGWLDEAHVEAVNARAEFGAVWAKRRGKGNPADWYVVIDGATFVELLVLREKAVKW